MYKSLRHLAEYYDVHPDTIRRKQMVEGVHYIQIGSTRRYHIENVHALLTGAQQDTDADAILDALLP